MRVLLRFLFSALGLLVASALIPGIKHGAFIDLLAVAVLLGLLNATLGSLLKFVAFMPVACTFGCFSLVINGLVFWLAGSLAGRLGLGFGVSGFFSGFFGAIISSVVSSLLEYFFVPKENGCQPPARRIKIVN